MNRITDRCKNITFATSLRTVKKWWVVNFSAESGRDTAPSYHPLCGDSNLFKIPYIVFQLFQQYSSKVRSFALIHVRGSSESTRCFYSVDTVNKKRTQSISRPSIFRLTVGKQQTQCTRIHLLLCLSWIRSPNENKYCFWNKSVLNNDFIIGGRLGFLSQV